MAARLGNMPVQRLSSAVAGVFLPAAARLQGAERASAYASVLRLLLLLVGPFCAWMIAAAPEILSILPARWAGLEPIVRAIAAGSVLEPVGTLAWALVAASGRADLLLRFSAVFVPAAWLLSLAGALSGSATGLAVTWAVTNSLGAIGIALLMPRATGAPGLGLGLLAGPLVLSAALGLCVRAGVDAAGLVRSPSGLLLGLAIAGATYGLCLAAFYRGVLRRGIGLIARAP
jgi:O-antigen/teichoic acid export membrane protein